MHRFNYGLMNGCNMRAGRPVRPALIVQLLLGSCTVVLWWWLCGGQLLTHRTTSTWRRSNQSFFLLIGCWYIIDKSMSNPSIRNQSINLFLSYHSAYSYCADGQDSSSRSIAGYTSNERSGLKWRQRRLLSH